MASCPVFYRTFVMASTLAAGVLMSAVPALADWSHNRYGWQGRHYEQRVNIYQRQTIALRKDRRDHNRDALTNAALLRQSILLSRSASNERCRGPVSAQSNCTTRGGALIVGAGR